MKSVLISIKPKWVEKIIKGEKTIEVRKTRPKIETPFKCYIYATQGQVKDLFSYNEWIYQNRMKVIGEFVCNNIEEFESEFWDDKTYESIGLISYDEEYGERENDIFAENGEDNALCKSACLTWNKLREYIGQGIKTFYGWHISDLKIYDEPKELSEFYKPFKYDGDGIICGTEKEMDNIYEWDCETLFKDRYPDFKFDNCDCKNCPKAKDFYRLTRPPKSWCYVEELEEE